MKSKINNIEDLRVEIARLSQLKKEQECYLADQYLLLKHKVEAPARLINTLTSSIPGVDFVKGLFSAFGGGGATKVGAADQSNWMARALQLGLPLILNRTFLKNSGWLKKAIVLLASDSAVAQVTQGKVSSLASKLAKFVRPKKSKKKHKDIAPLEELESQDVVNFGIPPDSETY
ncbi:hypothetical protein [Sphingobacterium paucimobilis]|uniref:Uncharacterized protein n=1 Tax=Sphingobacterium paucimobilis HER1398 TaxID=1346330 RepID=U2J541_9SPHI|nr:hypothetical protein [Sphingobacterium paucimobilis]ERJ57788.1 hypothetical protein M472_03315 [Sphingobacterium paucimobilis HER1398]ERJ60239.1 hypothetical protein M472_15885 [Sphingobacterium paucimobilis HER1398]